MTYIKVCVVISAIEKHMLEALVPDFDHVNGLPVLGEWMLPGHSVMWLCLENGVGYVETGLIRTLAYAVHRHLTCQHTKIGMVRITADTRSTIEVT